MILIGHPRGDTPLAIDLPRADSLCCEACGTTWDLADATPAEVLAAA